MLFSLILSIILVATSFGISAILTVMFPEICWTPRIGGILVGVAVFLQGYVFANPNKFTRTLRSQITLEQRVMHIAYTATIFGTLLWTFGDLMPSVFGIPNCMIQP